MKVNIKSEKHSVAAKRTNDGFIEITNLELLDALVGGYIDPEEVYCHVSDNQEQHSFFLDSEGIS